jgi:hypothetical protein
MEKIPNQPTGSEQKISEYVERIQNGESKDSIFDGLPSSFKTAIEKKLSETHRQRGLEEVRKKLGIPNTESSQVESLKQPPINYIEVVIDDAYIQKNLMPNNALRMQGGQANWNGEVDLMKYVISPNLSEQYRAMVEDKIKKFEANQEKTYQHESHHIQNRENGLTPYVAATNLREFLAFRVLDELTAFSTGELYKQDPTVENIFTALQKAKQNIQTSYYGEPFTNDAKWYTKQRGTKPEDFSREINTEKYHKIMRQYFKINNTDILDIIGKAGKLPEFTQIVNELILQLDELLEKSKESV